MEISTNLGLLKLQIRIAAPVGDFSHKAEIFSWNNLKLDDILARAKSACEGDPVVSQPALIGFSNGGYRARQIALNCRQANLFGKIFSIGAPKNLRPSSCGNGRQLINFKDHEMPPLNYFENQF